MSEELEKFRLQKQKQIESNLQNERLVESARQFNTESNKAFYSYNFSWMGRPIIAYPQNMIAMQELTLKLKPFHINETGIP